MLNAYFLMTILFLSMAALTALDNSLALFDLTAAFGGIRWLRVHFITLGTLTEAIFWLTPALAILSPLFFYPFAKLTWVAIDLAMHPEGRRDEDLQS